MKNRLFLVLFCVASAAYGMEEPKPTPEKKSPQSAPSSRSSSANSERRLDPDDPANAFSGGNPNEKGQVSPGSKKDVRRQQMASGIRKGTPGHRYLRNYN